MKDLFYFLMDSLWTSLSEIIQNTLALMMLSGMFSMFIFLFQIPVCTLKVGELYINLYYLLFHAILSIKLNLDTLCGCKDDHQNYQMCYDDRKSNSQFCLLLGQGFKVLDLEFQQEIGLAFLTGGVVEVSKFIEKSSCYMLAFHIFLTSLCLILLVRMFLLFCKSFFMM